MFGLSSAEITDQTGIVLMELDRQSTLEDSVIAIVRIKATEIGLTIVTGGADTFGVLWQRHDKRRILISQSALVNPRTAAE